MKILQINTIVNSGSTGRIAEDIGQVALNAGFESMIAYGRGDRPSASKLYKIGTNRDFYFHVFYSLLFDKHGLASKTATKKLIKKIIAYNPDVIYLHNIHGYYLNYPELFSYLKSVSTPIIWTLFDCWAFTGHCTYFDDINCEKWKTHCFECPKLEKYPTSLMLDNSKKNYEIKRHLFSEMENLCFVTNSIWLKQLVSKSFLSTKNVYHIATGVDLSVFNISSNRDFLHKYNFGNKKVILGVASIWDKRKGLDDFIRISETIGAEFLIVLVGLSDKQLKLLPTTIVGIKRTENLKELVELYNQADVFVNPTYQDNFPTTNIEALACGTPVITYNTGGSPEAIDSLTGLVVNKGDIDQLKHSIQLVCNNGKEYYSDYCRKRAEKFYNKFDRYQDYLNLIN